ncbi:MAG: hypothetical protein K2L05_08970 [Muribaculaceae bacterium]|nr:hypothetical protein [Muribaculaceae bacterium]
MFKKLLFAAALTATIGASAAPRLQKIAAPVVPSSSLFVNSGIVAPRHISAPVASRAETMVFQYCEDPVSCLYLNGMSDGTLFYQLTELPANMTKRYAGTELTAINIANPTNKNYVNTLADSVKVVIYTDLNSEPVYTQSAKLGSAGLEYSKVTLKTPYVITGETPVYFGYEMIFKTSYNSQSNPLYYVIIDAGQTPYGANYIGLAQSGQKAEFAPATAIGLTNNICITADANVKSEVTGVADAISLSFGPAAVSGEDFEFGVEVKNFGSVNITSVGVEYTVNGVENTVTCNLEEPVEGFATNYATVVARTDTAGFGIPITAKIVAVNGQPNTYEKAQTLSGEINVIEAGKAAKRNIVVEEATGTWCGWCPMGYVLLESVREKYDDVVVIAVHDTDNMATSSYDGFISQYISGYPQYLISRYTYGPLTENPAYNEYAFDEYHSIIASWPAIASIDFDTEVNPEKSTISITAETSFGLSGYGNYRLAVVVKEDSVGPYRQTNNLFGKSGWGVFTTNYSPSLLYNDVARTIKTWNGINNSLPTSIEAGEVYEFSTDITFSNVKGNECDVVLMLINVDEGSIEQAVSKHVVVRESGIEEINANGCGATEYFDLNGRKLDAPASGVNIVRQANGSTSKIFVK